MSFDQPLFLLLLGLAPLAWLVGRLRARRVVVEVPSLLIYERALARLQAAPAAARERRRRFDRRLLAEVLVLSALAITVAGPRLEASAAPRRVGLVLDDSPSMRAAGCPEAAAAAERDLRASLSAGDALLVARTSEAPAGVEDALAWAAAALAARGASPIHAITDHAPPGPFPGTPVVLAGAGPNRGIVAAGAREDEVLVRTSADEAVVVVTDAAGAEVLRGRGREVRGRLPASAAAGPLTARLEGGPDALADDDAVTLAPPGAPATVAVRGPLPAEVRRAIEAAGGRAVDAADPAAAGARLTVEVAAAPGDGPAPAHLVAPESARFRYADLAAQRVRVAPAPPPPGRALAPLLLDDRGRPLIAWGETAAGATLWIGIPLGLGESATDWMRQRTFPVAFAEALGAPPAGWRAIGLLSALETAEAGALRPSPSPPPSSHSLSPAPALSLVPAAAAGRPLSVFVLLAAALAVVAAWALARERLVGGTPCDAS